MSLRLFKRSAASRLAIALATTLATGLALASCQTTAGQPANPKGSAAVDGKRIENADKEPGSWMAHGRTYSEQRFSPLTQVNTKNVGQLGLAWFADFDTNRGQEATPIVVDGVLYVSQAWSKVNAYDAVTGKLLWEFDPQVPGQRGVDACCDVVNRGVAVWEGKVYVGTIDGRLIALDSKTGQKLWDVVTVDQSKPYTITGAPRVVKGKVIIGSGGAEFGVRGYVTAYDANTGAQVWRFYTVPGKPGEPDNAVSDKVLAEKALPTWHGEWWKGGGGGTAWDSFTYDPETDLLYLGVGNGSPWNRTIRSEGKGDNLFLTSIVAVNPDTGAYVWHYQETNGESWDHTACQQMIVADLTIDGKKRHVLMQAPKNGFFYVLDAKTGELISAKNFTPVAWADHIDMATGRPVMKPEARYDETGKPFLSTQNPNGAHDWHSMSYDPQTGLVYMPIHGQPFVYGDASKGFVHHDMTTNLGAEFSGNAALDPKEVMDKTFGRLIAWDPVKQKEVWRVERAGQANGGALSTAGGLVFEGTGSGQFTALDAKSGQQLWSTETQTGVIAAPITYEIGGVQYVAQVVGTGSSWALVAADTNMKGFMLPNRSRLLVYKLGGAEKLPPAAPFERPPLDPPKSTASAKTIAAGAPLYEGWCGTCHGAGANGVGLPPDLRRSAFIKDPAQFRSVVLDGALQSQGMASFTSVFDAKQVEAIRAYIIKNANDAKAAGVK
jgi:alcohol dehydrogenase (cytochrome c)/quinohemoprotein ethanol dehydrogenase